MMLKAVEGILDKFPTNEQLEEVDDDLLSGRRPAPIMAQPGFVTIAEVRAARDELVQLKRAILRLTNAS